MLLAVREQHIADRPQAADARVVRNGGQVIEDERAMQAIAICRRYSQSQDRQRQPPSQSTDVGCFGRESPTHVAYRDAKRIQIRRYLSSVVCRPHSTFPVPLQRPARSSSPNITARVQGKQPMLV